MPGYGTIRSVCQLSNLVSKMSVSMTSSVVMATPESRFSLTKKEIHTSCVLPRRPGIVYPNPVSRLWAWEAAGIDLAKYTHEAVPYVKYGGRGPDGRIQYKHVGGGLKRPNFMVDFVRQGDSITGEPIEERILQIKQTWWRYAYIALVARGDHKRWIIATNRMQPGDLIRSYSTIPEMTVIPKEGDSHPLGALPIGTIVCCVELHPGGGAKKCLAAGTSAILVRKAPEEGCVYVRMPNKRETKLPPTCAAVIGQVSNEDHKQQRYHKFGQKRWRGIRQRSGLYQKKTGRFGRKLRGIRPPIDMLAVRPVSRVLELRYQLEGCPDQQRVRKAAVHRYEVEPGREQPRFRWCSWSSVR